MGATYEWIQKLFELLKFTPCLQISKLEEVYAVKKYVPQLTYLDMSVSGSCKLTLCCPLPHHHCET